MRRRNVLIGALAIAVVAATIGGVAYALHPRVSVVCPGPTYRIPGGDGAPAIRPRNNCTPSFTQQDVRDYVAQGLPNKLGDIAVVAQPTVTRIVFLTFGDLIGARGWYNGLPFGVAVNGLYYGPDVPTDMLVCYVDVSGKFMSHDRFDPPGTLISSSAAFIVFDAHTGNLIGYSTGTLLR